ncbi:MAG: crossover junction endodeoxyribonuclease RuvC [Planctomycetes bacterium]|nr:crossover junction endodeoxyribonuclease RuvC [Planctomycetota bacterium]
MGKMMKINTMGLDLSLTSTGVSIGGMTESIRVDTQGVERLKEIRNRILETVAKQEINAVAVEGYSYASRMSHSHSLGELGGVVRLALFEQSIPFFVIAPTARAKFATGKGNAGKSEVVSAISAKTGIIWGGGDGGDRCDAWVLEQMLIAKLNRSHYHWSKEQLDALNNVDWTGLPNG